jgi:hypothetical protein
MEQLTAQADLGEYCRRIEDHLTRTNAGHLVRIVGPGFELVRVWADSGVPLSVVYRGIDLKAERHRGGASKRPLRIEFCAGDVQAVFDQWRRAVGIMSIGTGSAGISSGDATGVPASGDELPDASPKRRSLSRHLDRAIDRLSRAAARMDVPDGLREDCTRLLQALATIRESSTRLRGDARTDVEAALASLDSELSEAARRHAAPEWMDSIRAEAAADLAPFRSRLPPEAWDRSMNVTIDRLLRDRLGLPALGL